MVGHEYHFLLIQIIYFSSYISLRKQRKGLYGREDLNETSIKFIQIRLESEKHFLKIIAIICFVLALTMLQILIAASVVTLFEKGRTTADFSDYIMK